MAVGHETTGLVQQIRGEHHYTNSNERIRPGDTVVVIPLIPCGSCEICGPEFGQSDYGENYCPSARFMASDAPGSLRTKYRYDPRLLLRIPPDLDEKSAVFTELMSNIVQGLCEMGFGDTGALEFEMIFKGEHRWTLPYFHFPPDSFTAVFDTITAKEFYPRTVYLLDYSRPTSEKYRISLYNLQRKGLAVFGGTEGDLPASGVMSIQAPRILIQGTGAIGYILALLLSKVHGVSVRNLCVMGRTDSEKLGLFANYVDGTVLRSDFSDKKQLRETLLAHSGEEGFDIVFECMGRDAAADNVDTAIGCLREGGILGVFGLNGSGVEVDFARLVRKNLYLKGFYRGSLASFRQSLSYIAENDDVRQGLEVLKGEIREVSEDTELRDLLDAVAHGSGMRRTMVRLKAS